MIDLIKKALANMAGVMPNQFDAELKSKVFESDNVLTKEAAAFAVLQEYGFRLDSHVMGNRNSAVFTYLVTRNTHDSRSKEESE